jgi:hypothetical protein
MSDPVLVKALELANSHPTAGQSKDPADVVARAGAYHAFLLDGVTPPKAAGAQGATGAKATTAKVTPAEGTKSTATTKPGTAAPKPGAAAAAPKGDTKDPKGTNTYDDVVAALQKVMASVPGDNKGRDKGRALAYEILAAKGGGVKGVRDLKPALYDTVVAACEEATKPKKAAVANTVVTDDFGQPIDTSGASAEADVDLPEGGSGEDA